MLSIVKCVEYPATSVTAYATAVIATSRLAAVSVLGGVMELPYDPERPERDLLWIDDAVAQNDPSLQLLSLAGYRVDLASCGLDGLKLVERYLYRSVFLDLRLPDIRGLEVLATLRARGYTDPILVLTGFADIDSAFAAGQLGATQFRSKPLLDDIDEVLSHLLRGHHAPDGAPADMTAARNGIPSVGLSTLLWALDRLSGDCREEAVDAPSAGGAPAATVLGALLRALCQPDFPSRFSGPSDS